jgi:hypothetical protein
MERLKIELIGYLRGNELHRRSWHRLGSRVGVVEVVSVF